MLQIKVEESVSGFRALTVTEADGSSFEMICDHQYGFTQAIDAATIIAYGGWGVVHFFMIKIRPSSCPQHVKATKRFVTKYWKRMSGGTMDKDLEYAETGKCLSHLLTDWCDVSDANGNIIPFSTENALFFMTQPSLRTFRELVVHAADTLDTELKKLAYWTIPT